MTQPQAMPPARRRPIPGMASQSPAPAPPSDEHDQPQRTDPSPVASTTEQRTEPRTGSPTRAAAPANAGVRGARSGVESRGPQRRPAADYASTRLVNFRIPVDLHDRYRQLVREAEQRHPRLRHPSLTELVIALLEEGPGTADDVAELIRRKRAAEHGSVG